MDNVYFGPYVVVKSKKKRDLTVQSCVNKSCIKHTHHTPGNFCSECGSAVAMMTYKQVWDHFYVYDFCKKHFGRGGTFAKSVRDDGVILIANSVTQSGFVLHHGFDQIQISKMPDVKTAFLNGDWKKLIEALELDEIEYEARYGIVEVIWN